MLGSFLDTFQKIADAATNTKGRPSFKTNMHDGDKKMCRYAHFATLEKHKTNSDRFVRTDGLKAYFIAPVHQLI